MRLYFILGTFRSTSPVRSKNDGLHLKIDLGHHLQNLLKVFLAFIQPFENEL